MIQRFDEEILILDTEDRRLDGCTSMSTHLGSYTCVILPQVHSFKLRL
jgi:hypothetical protein